ncbi:MAG: agmatinase [Bradymonadales bacterium]|nr:MAG: agmatinase [Bradymonadales bacterium]
MAARKTPSPDPRKFPRYAGMSTFFRFPYEPNPTAVDWALYGMPFDQTTTYRSGARFGPRAIREQSAYIKPYHLSFKQDLLERYSLVDAGDSPVSPYSIQETLELQESFCAGWAEKGARCFAVGGDHSIALANIRVARKRSQKPLALIHFDSHTDTVDELWGEKYTHAAPVRRAIEEGLVEPGKILSIGIKGPVNTAEELQWGLQNGIQYVTYEDWRAEGLKRVSDFAKSLKDQEAYLSFDIDCLDPTFAPGTGTPSVGGFSSAEAIELVRQFRGLNLQGADLVEVAPDLDPGYTTALLGAHLIFEILSL